MLFCADLTSITSIDNLTIQIGIFDEFFPVEMHEDVRNSLTIRIGIFDEFIPVMHEDVRKIYINRISNDFRKIVDEL